MSPALLLGWSLSAHAADTIVIRADLTAADAARQVSRDGGPAAETLDTVTLTGLAGGRPPFIEGDGYVIPCGRAPTTAAAVGEASDNALRMLVRLDYESARDALEEALQTLGCQRDRADAGAAAQLYYLSGLVRIDQSWPKKARDDFAQAVAYQPDFPWDDRFNPEEGDGAKLLEEARAAVNSQPPATLHVVPQKSDITVIVDGEPVESLPVSLLPGEHVVQLEHATVTTVRVHLDPGGTATLAVPGILEESDAYAISDDTRARAIHTAIAPVLPPDADLWVAVPTGTWRGTSAGSFHLLEEHKPRTRKYVKANAWVAGVGGGILLGGALYSLVQLSAGQDAVTGTVKASSFDQWEAAVADRASAQQRYSVGLGIAGVGATTALVGATFPMGKVKGSTDAN